MRAIWVITWLGITACAASARPVPAEPTAEIDESRARGIARETVGVPCREGEVRAERREHAGRWMWRVECSQSVSPQSAEVHVVWIDAVSGDLDSHHSDIETVASTASDADGGEAKVDPIELESHGGRRPVRASEDTVEDRVDSVRAIEIARRALGDETLACGASLSSFDSSRRWTVRCDANRTVWVDAHTGDAELVGAATRTP